VLPDTRPNLAIGPDGVCNACASHGAKRDIDWAARKSAFLELVGAAKANSRGGYHCLIPVSGGKDSTWQVVTCLEHGLKPLCVSWRPPGRTALGEANLRNLVSLGVDHIDYTINPEVERRFLLKATERFGAPAIPMHMAIFNIPPTIAVRLGIPLVIWGENSAFEYGGPDEQSRGVALDEAWFRRFGVTNGTVADDWIGADLTCDDLVPYRGPNAAELAAAGTRAVFLGHYFPWDPETSLAVATAHGFRRAPAPRTGLYDYADIDDDFISVHHWFKWYKFGFTRLFDNLSIEVRNCRLTRDEAVRAIRERGDDTPSRDIDALCAFVGISRCRFFEIAETFRNPLIWCREKGQWSIPDFLIPDWNWS
jgi:N-acetyl sugar amidotransferase